MTAPEPEGVRLSEEEQRSLTHALHSAETTGGWWGHPECEEFARIVAPAVERILTDRLAARDQQVGAEAPVVCELCGERPATDECEHCHGSGCTPGTAGGAYEPCQWCVGAGKVHTSCAELSYPYLVARLARPEGEAGESERS